MSRAHPLRRRCAKCGAHVFATVNWRGRVVVLDSRPVGAGTWVMRELMLGAGEYAETATASDVVRYTQHTCGVVDRMRRKFV